MILIATCKRVKFWVTLSSTFSPISCQIIMNFHDFHGFVDFHSLAYLNLRVENIYKGLINECQKRVLWWCEIFCHLLFFKQNIRDFSFKDYTPLTKHEKTKIIIIRREQGRNITLVLGLYCS